MIVESVVGHMFNFQVIIMISFAALFIHITEHLHHIPTAPPTVPVTE
jgi:hypothetical protein